MSNVQGPLTPHSSPLTPHPSTFFSARDISDALGVSKRTIHNLAQRDQWPSRLTGNRILYSTPAAIAALLTPEPEPEPPQTGFANLTGSPESRARALQREQAVLFLNDLLAAGGGSEAALADTVTHFRDAEPRRHGDASFGFSARSLRRWADNYRVFGLNGLVDQKQGVVGRKPTHVPEESARRLKAGTLELGSVARSARREMSHPDLPAALRLRLHEGHHSKSYVTPAIRKAARVTPLAAALAQGPRHARLLSRFTPGDYSKVRAGDVFTSDDMTSNVVAWCEAPTPCGFRIGQPQILPVLDVGSLRWLNVRVLLREGGQYSSDDIWGLFGDVFDTFGLPRTGFVLEGGHWQARKVVGERDPDTGTRTGLHDDERVGGLTALGLRVIRSYDPRSKIIETCFNQLQHFMDAFPGYAGRDQRRQLPEAVKKQIALCNPANRKGPPPVHPREFFPHLSQLADHVRDSMEALNLERNDGTILRGRSALEKWAEEATGLNKLPDSAKWLYRSAMNVVQVTRNGVRITQGSGRKLVAHHYDNPALLVPRQGLKVIVWWNDHNPDASAVLVDFATRKFIGLASRVQPLDRFAATDAQLDAEAQRKKAAMHFARTELRAIQPESIRPTRPVRVDAHAVDLGRRISRAADSESRRRGDAETLRHDLARVPLTPDDHAAAVCGHPLPSDGRGAGGEGFSDDEISALFDSTSRGDRNFMSFPADRDGDGSESRNLSDPPVPDGTRGDREEVEF